MSAPTVPVPAEVLETLQGTAARLIWSRRYGRTSRTRTLITVSVEACECGCVPLNDAERQRCQRCKRHQPWQAWAGEGVEPRPVLRHRVLWTVERAS